MQAVACLLRQPAWASSSAGWSTAAGSSSMQQCSSLRKLARQASSKHAVREGGGVQALLALLGQASDPVLCVAAVEALACLAADDPATQVGQVPRCHMRAHTGC